MLTVLKQIENLAWVCIMMMILVIYSIMGKEFIKFAIDNENIDFPTQFCLGNISGRFYVNKLGEVLFKGNVYRFSFDYNVIDKFDILNIHKYLMGKNIVK